MVDKHNNVGREIDLPYMKFTPDGEQMYTRDWKRWKIVGVDRFGIVYHLVDAYGREKVLSVEETLRQGTNLA